MTEKKRNVINGGLKHKPIIFVDYEPIDLAGDALLMSIGESQWCQGEGYTDYSGKIFREGTNGRWSRQSEELPLWRVLDLARLVISVILGCDSGMNEKEVTGMKVQKIQLENFIQNNLNEYLPRIDALKEVIIAGQQKVANAYKKTLSQISVLAMMYMYI